VRRQDGDPGIIFGTHAASESTINRVDRPLRSTTAT
jgi:hypothetical protein